MFHKKKNAGLWLRVCTCIYIYMYYAHVFEFISQNVILSKNPLHGQYCEGLNKWIIMNSSQAVHF